MKYFVFAITLFLIQFSLAFCLGLEDAEGNQLFPGVNFNTSMEWRDNVQDVSDRNVVSTIIDVVAGIITDIINFFTPLITKDTRDLLWNAIFIIRQLGNLLGVPDFITDTVFALVNVYYMVGIYDLVMRVRGVQEG